LTAYLLWGGRGVLGDLGRVLTTAHAPRHRELLAAALADAAAGQVGGLSEAELAERLGVDADEAEEDHPPVGHGPGGARVDG